MIIVEKTDILFEAADEIKASIGKEATVYVFFFFFFQFSFAQHLG